MKSIRTKAIVAIVMLCIAMIIIVAIIGPNLREDSMKTEDVIAKLREALHDLLGQWDGRDPDTDGPIDLETSGARIRKAQKILAEVE